MAEDTQESLKVKWAGHFVVSDTHHIMQNLLHCLNTKTLCDVTLVAGNVEIPCHRFVLCASSDVFNVMLTSSYWSEATSPRVVLHEPPECLPVFQQFIHYMYCGNIDVALDGVLPLLMLADKYNVKSLIWCCWEHLSRFKFSGLKKNLILDWIARAKLSGGDETFEEFCMFLRLNFNEAVKSTDWSKADLSIFCHIINSPHVAVDDERTMFSVAESWLTKKLATISDPAEKKTVTETVLGCIRYPMMTPAQLASLSISPLAPENNTFLMKRIAQGISYHCGKLDLKEFAMDSTAAQQIYPRIYTASSLCGEVLLRSVDSMHEFQTATFPFTTCFTLPEYLGENTCQWVVELNLRGLVIERGVLLGYDNSLIIPGGSWQASRLSVCCRGPSDPSVELRHLRAKVTVLIFGNQNTDTCVIEFKEQIHHFSPDSAMIHFNDIIPFSEIFTAHGNLQRSSKYAVGPLRQQVQFLVVINPLPQSRSNRPWRKKQT